MIIAHSSPDGKKEPHTLEIHTKGVKKRAIEKSQSFDPYGITAVAALAHDLGKKTEEFQNYIRSDIKKRGSVRHALGGTIILERIKDLRAKLAGLIVAGHHAGLPDASNVYQDKIPNAVSYLKKLPELTRQEEKEIIHTLKEFTPLPDAQKDLDVYFDLLVKMCFSALVDADYLDTEEYMDLSLSELRYKNISLTITKLQERLNKHMDNMIRSADETPINKRRAQIYHTCVNEGINHTPFRSLNVPTGLGKTLASMGYALEHAVHFNKKRIIVALPYTSIIDQNAEVYKNVFGSDTVLEHHSQVNYIEDDDEQMIQSRLASENWDKPIIITTTVQLFESLFSNRTSKCRKLHNIVDSVIILDEFQQLPFKVLKPIFRLLKTLIEKFNVTVLVSSATPLSFDKPELFGNINAPVEIYPYNHELFEEMKRVNFKRIKNPLSIVELVEIFASHDQLLCIVNTKKDALSIYKEMRKQKDKKWRHIFHLSTSMCPYHRKKVIGKIREVLKNKQSVAVISTQLIEAGVDFDFPVVFRALAPIDSIVQAAGRCNREGKLDRGTLYIFELIEGGLPLGNYRKGTSLAENFLNEEGVDSLHQLQFYIRYFRELYSFQSENGLDEYEITSLKPFNYEKVNSRFKMIEQDTITVICRYYPNDKANDIIEGLLDQIKYLPYLTKQWYRTAQLFSVNLYRNSRFITENRNLLIPISDNWYVWEGRYDADTGITDSLDYNSDELVI